MTQEILVRKRFGRVDWRLISAIDPDTILRKGDIAALQVAPRSITSIHAMNPSSSQAIIENLTFADVETEGARSLADANLVKLCRLSQLCLEYLLHCQAFLERSVAV
jgi:zinc finger protein DZIP1